MISVLDNDKKCTGCCACLNICPSEAICIEEDEYGFFRAKVDSDKCINCEKCRNMCPQINYIDSNFKTPYCYAVKGSDEIRFASSTGGVFSVIANWVLEKKGIVFGAAFDKRYKLCCIKAENQTELNALKKSKYVQSFVGDALSRIKRELENGRFVLFSGTPCQVAGLYNYLGKDYELLITLDFICHGVPSQKMFREDVIDNYGLDNIIDIDFRDKKYGWRADILRVALNDSDKELTQQNCMYSKAFHSNLSLNDCCYECKFNEMPRIADFSCADFYNIEKYLGEEKDELGVSMLLINSDKASEWFTQNNERFAYKVDVDLNFAKSNNRLCAHQNKHWGFERFRELYKNKAFSNAVMQVTEKKYDMALVGNWNNRQNYGSALTYYALYLTLTSLGYSVIMVGPPQSVDRFPQQQPLFRNFPYPNYAIDKVRKDINDMRMLNEICNCFVVGSDQLFQMNIFHALGDIVDLHWVSNEKQKVSYAASFGYDYISGTDSERARLSYFLKKFDYFSVREISALDIAEREYGITAELVLDPVFLVDKKDYIKMISSNNVQSNYIFAYILNPSKDKEDALNYIASKLGKRIIALSDAAYSQEKVSAMWNIETLYNIKIEDYLSYIYYCDIFITDSFHGTCFAIIFNKNFISIVNPNRGATRFYSLLEQFALSNRMINDIEDIYNNEELIYENIQYSIVNNLVAMKKQRSIEWLKKALIQPNKKAANTLDIVEREINIYNRQINKIVEDYEKELFLCKSAIIQQQKTINHLANKLKLPICKSSDYVKEEYAEENIIGICKNGVKIFLEKEELKFMIPNAIDDKVRFFVHLYAIDDEINESPYGFINKDFYYKDKIDRSLFNDNYKGACIKEINFEFNKIRIGQYNSYGRLWCEIFEM